MNISGLHWNQNGQSTYSGSLLNLAAALDALFLKIAKNYGAVSYSFPPFISADEMNKIDYFRSFPHLATFPCCLSPISQDLHSFAAKEIDATNLLSEAKISPVKDVLTPAACYHFYVLFKEQDLKESLYFTTKATCFRREVEYFPLRRQWSFLMREIVCIGSSGDVNLFIQKVRDHIDKVLVDLDVSTFWASATDPFFEASANKLLMQKIDPVKNELTFEDSRGKLAIGSTNVHRDFFGQNFKINMKGQPAHSGCVAFGIDRWLYTLVTRFKTPELALEKLETLYGP